MALQSQKSILIMFYCIPAYWLPCQEKNKPKLLVTGDEMIRSWCLMIFEYVWLACNRHRWCWCMLNAVHQYSRELEYVGIAISMPCYVRIIFQLLVSFNFCWMILWPSTSMFPSLFTPTLRFHLCEARTSCKMKQAAGLLSVEETIIFQVPISVS